MNRNFIPLLLNRNADKAAETFPIKWTPTSMILDAEGTMLREKVGGTLSSLWKLLKKDEK